MADKEGLKITEEDEKKMAEKVSVGGVKLVVEAVLNRRKLKNRCVRGLVRGRLVVSQ